MSIATYAGVSLGHLWYEKPNFEAMHSALCEPFFDLKVPLSLGSIGLLCYSEENAKHFIC
jgi:hypothetical protein